MRRAEGSGLACIGGGEPASGSDPRRSRGAALPRPGMLGSGALWRWLNQRLGQKRTGRTSSEFCAARVGRVLRGIRFGSGWGGLVRGGFVQGLRGAAAGCPASAHRPGLSLPPHEARGREDPWWLIQWVAAPGTGNAPPRGLACAWHGLEEGDPCFAAPTKTPRMLAFAPQPLQLGLASAWRWLESAPWQERHGLQLFWKLRGSTQCRMLLQLC